MIDQRPAFRRLFLHYFDVHFLELKGLNGAHSNVKWNIIWECKMATRIAVLAANEVILPAASFFESEICNKIITELNDLYQFGLLKLVGGGTNLSEYIDDKLGQYETESSQSKAYRKSQKSLRIHPAFLSRRNSASKDIKQGWLGFTKKDKFAEVLSSPLMHLPRDFEDKWVKIPDLLEARAFIAPHVFPLFIKDPLHPTLANTIKGLINEQYFGSFTREYSAGVLSDLNYLAPPHDIPSYDTDLPYQTVLHELRKRNLLTRIYAANCVELLTIKDDPVFLECLAAATANFDVRTSTMNIRSIVMGSQELERATIGIITALPKEFVAVCSVLGAGEPIVAPGSGAGRKYALAHVNNKSGGSHTVAITLLPEMGNNSAAIRATQMIQHCKNVHHIIMVGIAGAIPCPAKASDHVRLGDIVVSNRNGVIQYDFDKEMPTETEYRHPPRPPAAPLIEAVKFLDACALQGKYSWETYINSAIAQLGPSWSRPREDKDQLRDWDETGMDHPTDSKRRLGQPKVFHGPIASANKLLKNPIRRDALREKFGVRAVEMEASGIADATWVADAGYLVVRGTCDYCNPDKGDEWQEYASIIAAGYTRALLEELPE